MVLARALAEVPDTLADNPLIAVVALSVSLVAATLGNLQFLVGPDAASLQSLAQVLTFLAGPFFAAGLYGMVHETRHGNGGGLGSFFAWGAEYFLSLLGVALLKLVGVFAVALAAGIVAVILIFVPIVGPIVAALLGVALGLAVGMVLLFVDVNVVLGEQDAFSTFRASYRLVADNLATVFGYLLLRLFVQFLFLLPFLWAVWAQFPSLEALRTSATAGQSLGAMVQVGPRGLAGLVVSALPSVVLYPLHVAVFEGLEARRQPDPPSGTVATTPGPGHGGAGAGAVRQGQDGDPGPGGGTVDSGDRRDRNGDRLPNERRGPDERR